MNAKWALEIYFQIIRWCGVGEKIKKYRSTKFMAKSSYYDKDAADYTV